MNTKKMAAAATTVLMMNGALADNAGDNMDSTLTFAKENDSLTVTANVQSCTADRHLVSLFLTASNVEYTETDANKLTNEKLEAVEQSYNDNMGPVVDSLLGTFTSAIESDTLRKFETPDLVDFNSYVETTLMPALFMLSEEEGMQFQFGMMAVMGAIMQNEAAYEAAAKRFENDIEENLGDHFDLDVPEFDMNTPQPQNTEDTKARLTVSKAPSPMC